MVEVAALFEPAGDLLVPTTAALGPWRPDGLHGGAVAGLLARGLDRDGCVLARMTMDLLGRVPKAPLRLLDGARWASRRIQRQTVELWAGDRIVAKAEGLFLPDQSIDVPDSAEEPLPGPPDGGETDPRLEQAAIVKRVGYPSFVSHAVAMRVTTTMVNQRTMPVTWLNLLVPVVSGEPLTGVQRAVVAADYANGGFANMSFKRWSFMSLDLTVQLVRTPVGPWIGVACDPLAQDTGVGLGDAELHDSRGRIGRATTTLLIEPR